MLDILPETKIKELDYLMKKETPKYVYDIVVTKEWAECVHQMLFAHLNSTIDELAKRTSKVTYSIGKNAKLHSII